MMNDELSRSRESASPGLLEGRSLADSRRR